MKYINNNIKHAKEKVYTRKCHARLGSRNVRRWNPIKIEMMSMTNHKLQCKEH